MISEELVEKAARALAWEDLACGDAAGVVKTVVDARWREYVAKARTLVEAVAPAIRAEALEEVMRHVPTTTAMPGESDWARGFYDCQMKWSAAIRAMTEQA